MDAKKILLLWFCVFPAFSADLGVFGKVYPITEFPADRLIEKKINAMTSEDKLKFENIMTEKTKSWVKRPNGIHLPRVIKWSKRLFNPTVIFKSPVLDPQTGRVVIAANSHVNPLEHVSLTKPLVFFDGDDKAQAQWVKTHYSDAVLILVNGEPLKLQNEWQRKVFFDQHGKLVSHFSVVAVPSVVLQDGKQLRIEECDVTL